MRLKRLSALTVIILLMLTLNACKNETSVVKQHDKQKIINQDTSDKIKKEKRVIINNNEENQVQVDNKTVEISQNHTLKDKTDDKNTNPSLLSNKKHAWGLSRVKNNLQPRIDLESAKLSDKYNAIYLGSKEEKIVYLTFDEGYENGYTGLILDTLKKHNVKATFFITMPYLQKELPLVKRMLNEGHIVGNHTVNHPSMPDVNDDKKLEEEILGLDRAFYEKTKTTMKFIRPPKGEFSERTLDISKKMGYTHVFWSFAYADWDPKQQKGIDYAAKMVIDNLHNGGVILLHAVSKDNAEGLDIILSQIKSKGYKIEPLDKFIR